MEIGPWKSNTLFFKLNCINLCRINKNCNVNILNKSIHTALTWKRTGDVLRRHKRNYVASTYTAISENQWIDEF